MKTFRQCRYNGENEDWKGWKMNLCYVKSKKFCKENRNIEYDTMILILNRLGIITSYICYGNPLTLKELTVHHVCDISYRMIQRIEFEEPITSFQDIIKRNMKTGVPWSEVPKNLRHKNDKIFREFIYCHTSKICLDRVATQRDLAILTLDRIGDQLLNSYEDVDGRPLIQRLDPPYISVHIVAFLPKGHPFLLRLNRYLRDLMNFGILPKIISKFESKFSEVEWKTSGPYKLKVEHLKAPNVLLLIGLSLSVLTFIWELLKARILGKEMRLSLDI
ncbi:hypothetical protein HHI36_015666 [Cryptolaemus montrouzieri]|uniref:Uncharacterized protein n=1 Tax=Cryptolaemus montrouzieri TaxID=559131 RepID=A0ABD2N735_9CUCU